MKVLREWWNHTGWAAVCVFLAVALLVASGIKFVDTVTQPQSGTVSIGVVGQKVITIGDEAQAAGSVDYTFGATNANVQFQTALNALPATGGRLVVVSSVQVNWAAATTVTRAIPNVTIQGASLGTHFVGDGATPIFTAGGDNWTFEDFSTDAGGLSMGATTGWSWYNVIDGTNLYAMRNSAYSVVGGKITTTDSTLVTNLNADLLDGQHAPSGAIVGTTDSQALSNKDLSSTTNIFPPNSFYHFIALSDAPATAKIFANVTVAGNADDEIRAAITAGWSTIRISQGTGTISANITLPTLIRAVDIGGAGTGSTNLTMADNANDVMFIIGSGAAAVEAAGSIHDMTLNGNKANQTYGVGIKAISGLHDKIRDLRIDDFNDYGVWVEGATSANRPDYIYGENVWITNSGIANLWVSKWIGSGTFVGLKSSDTPTAISMNGTSSDINFINPNIWNLTYRGFDIYEATKLTVLGIDADGSGKEMIYITGSTAARSIAFIGGTITEANTTNASTTNFVTYNNVNDFIIQGINFYETADNADAYIGGAGAGGIGTIIGNRANGTSGKAVVASWDAAAVRVRDNVGTGWSDGTTMIIGTNSGQYASTEYTASVDIDWSDGNVQYLVLANGANTITMANPVSGGRYLLYLRQPASGAAGTVTWPATVNWGSAGAPTLSTSNNSTDAVSLGWNATNSKYLSQFAGGF